MKYLSLELEMVTRSPLVTGEIKLDLLGGKGAPKPVRKTADGRVAVVLYGPLRAYLEKILRANGESVCDSGTPKTCGHCVLCDLFGSLGKAGRAVIDDLVSEKPASEIVHPSMHIRINRQNGAVDDSLQQEEVEEGAVFRGRILIDSPKPRDLELIQAGLDAVSEWGIGGWKTRGRGRAHIKITKLEEKSWQEYLERAKKKLKEIK